MNPIHGIRHTALAWTVQVLAGATRGLEARVGERERGDVPGWVLITIMTAGLVTLLWGIAGDTFQRNV